MSRLCRSAKVAEPRLACRASAKLPSYLVATAMLAWALTTHGAILTVTTVNDTVNASDGCSLREAITAVDNAADFSDCLHTGSGYTNSDTIAFDIAGTGVHYDRADRSTARHHADGRHRRL